MTLQSLATTWLAHWPAALALWSKFTRLSEPRLYLSDKEAAAEGLIGSFAMIRFADQAVVINLAQIARQGLDDFALEILGHEIGHHVYAPGDLTDQARMIARMRWALPTREHLAEFVANLYTDLLINDRLQRGPALRMADVYLKLGGGSQDRAWTLYMRIYEILWSLTTGTLATGAIPPEMEGDARLGARLIRAFARDWLDGSGRFAALLLPYLLSDDGAELAKLLAGWLDTHGAAGGEFPAGLTEEEAGEREGARHPALDPDLSGLGEGETAGEPAEPAGGARPAPHGQARQPFEYGEILRALGLRLDDHEVAVRYYRERAAPHLIPFPARVLPPSTEPLPEGLEPWEIGEPLENVDWLRSVLANPAVIPGVTTVQRTWGAMEGTEPQRQPLDLDLYVDCSGSMPDPQHQLSYLTLAGAIIALSALRAGGRVQATLWSGKNQFDTTGGFISDERRVLRILTGYLGGGTAFPIHLLRDTYAARKPSDRPVHILVISDDGVTTMFDKDERGASGWDIAAAALERARGGGTLALNLYQEIADFPDLVGAQGQGWEVHRVRTWEELVAFARAFSARKYRE